MNNDEAKKAAGRMTYGDAFRHACAGKRIPYKKATLTKIGELVEKQTPKQVRAIYGGRYYRCPVCNEQVAKKQNYCEYCGQKLKEAE